MHLGSMQVSKPETRSHLSGNITTTYRFYFLNIKPAYICPFAICSSSSARTTMKGPNLVTLPTLVPLPLSWFFTTELSWYIPSTNLITDPWFLNTSVSATQLHYPWGFPCLLCCWWKFQPLCIFSVWSPCFSHQLSRHSCLLPLLFPSYLSDLNSLEFPQRNFPWTFLNSSKPPIISSQSTLHLYLSFEALSEVEPYVCVISDICFSL